MATSTVRSNEGVVIKLPGNNTETDFREMLRFAAQIIRSPDSVDRHHREAVAIALKAWAEKAKVVP